MTPTIYRAFERICSGLNIKGQVLELGASPRHPTLLSLPSLQQASRRIGVGLDGASEGDGHTILHRSAHDLSCFEDGTFELVLSNSMLEHDPAFWRSLHEARRVLAPHGWLVLGVPGFGQMGDIPFAAPLKEVLLSTTEGRKRLRALTVSSLTLGIHDYPGDYFRFSPQAMQEVLLEGLVDVQVTSLMQPPRILGMGRKP
jgi:SAM-dependent methyltransferase